LIIPFLKISQAIFILLVVRDYSPIKFLKLMKKHLLWTVWIMVAGVTITFGQTLTGRVTSNSDGTSLPGVSVLVKGTTNGTTTDMDGKYSINVQSDATLVFSFIGYLAQTISISGRTTLDVAMEEDVAQLGDVVVTALGIKKQKTEINYTAEVTGGDEIVQSSSPNIGQALSGKVAGLNVTQPNGVEGGKTRLVLRGNTSFKGNNEPLIVVDGLQFTNSGGLDNITAGQDWGSALNMINPDIIDEVTILKGPSAAALYGARGANGVIYITTKKGKKRPGLGIEYSVDHRMIQPFGYREVQNTYGAGHPGFYRDSVDPTLPKNANGDNILPSTGSYDGFTNPALGMPARTGVSDFSWFGSGMSWGANMEGQDVIWWDGVKRPYSPQPDNLKEYFRNGNTTTHNISFSGGGDGGTFRVGISRADHDAMVPNSNYDQTSINIGSDLNLSSKVKAQIAVNYINYNRLNSPILGQSDQSWQSWMVYDRPRDWRPLDKNTYQNVDGSRRDFQNFYEGNNFTHIDNYVLYSRNNNWWNYNNNNTTLQRNKLFGTITLNYEITPWLTAMGRLGMDYNTDKYEQKNKPVAVDGLNSGYYRVQNEDMQIQNHDFLLTAHKEGIIDGLDARLGVGGSTYSRNISNINGSTWNWVVPNQYSLSNYGNPADRSVDSRKSEYRINSLFGFMDLAYKKMLFLEVTARNDWSSTLPVDQRSYLFPSVNLGFSFTELQAVKDLNLAWLSFGKIRASYASSAKDLSLADQYAAFPSYSSSTYGGGLVLSLPGNVPATGLKAETTTSYELGFNLGLFNDRVIVDFSTYKGKTVDQLLTAPLAPSAGASSFLFNTGELENKGLELQVDARVIKGSSLSWDLGLRLTKYSNIVKSLGPKGGDGKPLIPQVILDELWGPYGPGIYLREGDAFGTIYGYDFTYAPNGQKILTADGTHYLSTPQKVAIGNATPKALIGLTNSLSYKGLRLSTLVDFKIGGDMYSGTWSNSVFTGQSPITTAEREGGGLPYTDRDGKTANVGVILPGVFQNPDGSFSNNTNVVHYIYKYAGNMGSGWGNIDLGGGQNTFFLNSPAVFDNTFVKMRELSLSYQVPNNILSKARIFQSLNVYVTGRDLFYFYKNIPDNINPEGNNASASNAQGIEWGALPITRTLSLGLRASF
jgi:iron complex outermembrane recepter protein